MNCVLVAYVLILTDGTAVDKLKCLTTKEYERLRHWHSTGIDCPGPKCKQITNVRKLDSNQDSQ